MENQQLEVCKRFNADFMESPLNLKVGIASNIKEGLFPINGLRINPEGDTTGWYIWAGENLSDDEDFFQPTHVEHLDNWNPLIKKFLGLSPGWRFLVTNDYEDVWFDEELLK
jgi:hypothetical protein